MTLEKLDNPTWHALNETHQAFCFDYEGTKFYNPDFAPFGGYIDIDSTKKAMNQYAFHTNVFFVVGEKPQFETNLTLKNELIYDQMILENHIQFNVTEEIIELKSSQQKNELLNLINLIKPGYFKNKTTKLGRYYGIYADQNLVAVTGERMKMNDFTEISAVVTHPENTGKGYAKQLVTHVCKKILNEQKTPFLHVAESNFGAIKPYEKLEFKLRRKISFWHFLANEK